MSSDSENSDPNPERDLEGHNAGNLMKIAALSEDGISGWQPPPPEELNPLMDGYEILQLIGRGGMGAVYKGIQTNLDREVAIKLLPPELGKNPEFEARFKREARAMAKLNHPNIVQVHDFGKTSDGHCFFAMEFVEGTDLHQFIQNGRLESNVALNAVRQICDALQYAHEKGFVHRDIKPANIYLNTSGALKIGDFGLAKLVEGNKDNASAGKMGLTGTGMAMGTPYYVAPEQMDEAVEVDQRADIYSLGIMFYEMLTGEVPRGAFKEPSKKVPDLDVRIDGVVFKAMEPNRDERYQTATDLRSDVDVIRATPMGIERVQDPGSVRKGGRKQRLSTGKKSKSIGPVIAGLVSILIVTGLIYWVNRESQPEPGGEPATSSSQTPVVEAMIPEVRHDGEGARIEVEKKSPEPVVTEPAPELPISASLNGEMVKFYNTTRGGRNLPTTDDPEKATKEMPYENSLGMRFVPVPEVDGRKILFSIWETRVKDFRAFVDATGYRQDQTDEDSKIRTISSSGWEFKPDARWDRLSFPQKDDEPVGTINAIDALAFCSWLSGEDRKNFRLPSDAEWSRAIEMDLSQGETNVLGGSLIIQAF